MESIVAKLASVVNVFYPFARIFKGAPRVERENNAALEEETVA